MDIFEAAAQLGMTADQLLDWDQSLDGDWDHEFTQEEVDDYREYLDNLDEPEAVYLGDDIPGDA